MIERKWIISLDGLISFNTINEKNFNQIHYLLVKKFLFNDACVRATRICY